MTCLAENLSAEHITSSQNPGRRRQRTQRKTGRSHEKTVRNGCRMDDPRPTRRGRTPAVAGETHIGAAARCHLPPAGADGARVRRGRGPARPPRDRRGWEWCSGAGTPSGSCSSSGRCTRPTTLVFTRENWKRIRVKSFPHESTAASFVRDPGRTRQRPPAGDCTNGSGPVHTLGNSASRKRSRRRRTGAQTTQVDIQDCTKLTSRGMACPRIKKGLLTIVLLYYEEATHAPRATALSRARTSVETHALLATAASRRA